jgi:hypothetical protein
MRSLQSSFDEIIFLKLKTAIMDEKTRVIPTNVNPQSNAANRPATPGPQQPVNRPAVQPAVNAQNSLLKPGQPGTIQKKRVITGFLAVGGLLGGAFLVSGLKNPDETLSEGPGQLAGTPSTAFDEPTASTSKMVSITTDHPVCDVLVDDLSPEDAKEVARAEVGPFGIYSHRGRLEATATEEEVASLTPEQRADYLSGIVTHEISGINVNTTGREMEVHVAGMESYGSILDHADGTVYCLDMDGNASFLENVSSEVIVDQETGEPLINPVTGNELFQHVRTDPVSGEQTLYSPSAILQNVAQGRIDVSMYSSNVEIVDGQVVLVESHTPIEPTSQGTYLIIDDGGAGWDTDGDGEIDNWEYSTTINGEVSYPVGDEPNLLDSSQLNTEVDLRTDREIAMEKVQTMAEDKGIDVNKIRLHESDDGGFDYKIKGDDGKLKGHLSAEDLRSEESSAPVDEISNTINESGTDTGIENTIDDTLNNDQNIDQYQQPNEQSDIPSYYTSTDDAGEQFPDAQT